MWRLAPRKGDAAAMSDNCHQMEQRSSKMTFPSRTEKMAGLAHNSASTLVRKPAQILKAYKHDKSKSKAMSSCA
jgi:hypothetical protein